MTDAVPAHSIRSATWALRRRVALIAVGVPFIVLGLGMVALYMFATRPLAILGRIVRDRSLRWWLALGVGAVVAALFGGCSTVVPTAPRSSLDRDRALQLAAAAAREVKGDVRTIAATGSMRPVLDEGSVIALDPAPFEQLRAGDIVVYRARNGAEIIHRLYQLQGQQWLALGDANGLVDREPVTRDNYRGRVAAIFYTTP